MKDGVYDVGLHSTDLDIHGRLSLEGDTTTIRGSVNVTIEPLSATLVKARLDVRLGPTASDMAHLPRHFALNATGEASETGFDLLGVGPYGISIQVTGEWIAPLVRDVP